MLVETQVYKFGTSTRTFAASGKNWQEHLKYKWVGKHSHNWLRKREGRGIDKGTYYKK